MEFERFGLPMMDESRFPGWLEYVMLAVVAAILVFAGNDRVSLWDRDEPRYAETARHMARTGDWIVPYFNGEFRFQKPVLTYWVVAGCYRLLGESLFAARLCSGLSVMFATLIVCSLGNRMFGRPAGVISALLFLLCPVTILLGKLCIPDGLQLLFASVVFWSLWRIIESERTGEPAGRTAFLFWLAMGLAILVKGPIIPGMAATTIVGYCLLVRKWPTRLPMRWGMGAIVLAAVTLPWFIAIYYTAGQAFYAEAVGKQIGGRLSQSFDGKLLPPGYYAASLLIGFAPWIALSLHAMVRWRRQWRTEGPFAYLIAWSTGPMILLELFRSKQIHYYAPAYPALALLAGGYVTYVLHQKAEWVRGRHARVFNGFWLTMNLVVAGAFLAVGWFGPPATQTGSLILGACLGATAIATTFVFSRQRPLQAVCSQAVVLAVTWLTVGNWLLPAMEPARVLPTISQRLADIQRERKTPILLHQIMEPSLVYYSGLELPISFEDDEYVLLMNATSSETLTLLTETSLERLAPQLRGRVKVLESFHGWVKMHPDVVHLCLYEPDQPQLADSQAEKPTKNL